MKKFRVYLIAAAILTIIVIAVIVLRSYYLFLKEPVAQLATAIPPESVIIIKAGSFSNFTKIIQSSALAGMLEMHKVKYGFRKLSETIDSLGNLSSNFKEISENTEFMIALVPDRDQKPGMLFSLAIGKTKPGRFTSQLTAVIPGLKIDKIRNKHADFYKIIAGEAEIWYYIYHGILSFAYNRDILSQSLNTIVTNKTLLNDLSFARLIETSGKRVDAVMMINNSRLVEMALQSTENPLSFPGSPFTGWTTLDLNIDKEQVLMDGFTTAGVNGDLLIGQEPLDENLLKYFPRETAVGINLSLSDQGLFTGKFCNSDTLQVEGYDSANQIVSREIFRHKEHLNAWIGQSVSIAAMPEYFYGHASDLILLISVKNADSARMVLKPFLEPFNSKLQILRARHIPERLWGKLFTLRGQQYCYFSDKLLAISASPELLEQYALNTETDQLLGSAPVFQDITANVGEKSNIFIYVKPSVSRQYLQSVTRGEQTAKSRDWTGVLSGADVICLQYSAGGPLVYTHAFALLAKNGTATADGLPEKKNAVISSDTPEKPIEVKKSGEKEKNEVKESHAASGHIALGPFLVSGNKTSEKRILLFTDSEQLRAFSPEGVLLWSFQCRGKPVGQVNEIDFYRNGGRQYMVATGAWLHLIDKDGKELKSSPVRVPGGISGNIAVFDYDRKRDYRIVYPGKDHKLHNITLKGESIPDWQQPGTGKKLAGPAQFFRTAGKDFILFADRQGRLTITDRRGKVRIPVPENFNISANSAVFENKSNNKGLFLMASASGKLAYIDATGKVTESAFGDHGNNPYFDYLDFDGDASPDFIFSGNGQITVYNRMKKVIFEASLKNAAFGKPFVTDFPSGEKWLAARDNKSGRIVLINSKGKQPEIKNIRSDTDPVILRQGKNNGAVLVTFVDGKPVQTPLKK